MNLILFILIVVLLVILLIMILKPSSYSSQSYDSSNSSNISDSNISDSNMSESNMLSAALNSEVPVSEFKRQGVTMYTYFPEPSIIKNTINPYKTVGIAMSGGGGRAYLSAAGCLSQLETDNLLKRTKIQYISAVSGGTWAVLPWLYGHKDVKLSKSILKKGAYDIADEMSQIAAKSDMGLGVGPNLNCPNNYPTQISNWGCQVWSNYFKPYRKKTDGDIPLQQDYGWKTYSIDESLPIPIAFGSIINTVHYDKDFVPFDMTPYSSGYFNVYDDYNKRLLNENMSPKTRKYYKKTKCHHDGDLKKSLECLNNSNNTMVYDGDFNLCNVFLPFGKSFGYCGWVNYKIPEKIIDFTGDSIVNNFRINLSIDIDGKNKTSNLPGASQITPFKQWSNNNVKGSTSVKVKQNELGFYEYTYVTKPSQKILSSSNTSYNSYYKSLFSGRFKSTDRNTIAPHVMSGISSNAAGSVFTQYANMVGGYKKFCSILAGGAGPFSISGGGLDVLCGNIIKSTSDIINNLNTKINDFPTPNNYLIKTELYGGDGAYLEDLPISSLVCRKVDRIVGYASPHISPTSGFFAKELRYDQRTSIKIGDIYLLVPYFSNNQINSAFKDDNKVYNNYDSKDYPFAEKLIHIDQINASLNKGNAKLYNGGNKDFKMYYSSDNTLVIRVDNRNELYRVTKLGDAQLTTPFDNSGLICVDSKGKYLSDINKNISGTDNEKTLKRINNSKNYVKKKMNENFWKTGFMYYKGFFQSNSTTGNVKFNPPQGHLCEILFVTNVKSSKTSGIIFGANPCTILPNYNSNSKNYPFCPDQNNSDHMATILTNNDKVSRIPDQTQRNTIINNSKEITRKIISPFVKGERINLDIINS